MSPQDKAYLCRACGREASFHDVLLHEPDGRHRIYVHCERCGKYLIETVPEQWLEHKFAARRHLLSGITRNTSEAGRQTSVTRENLETLLSSAHEPSTPAAALDPVLLQAARISPAFAAGFEMFDRDYPLFFLRSGDDLRAILEHLAQIGWIEPIMPTLATGAPGWRSRLTIQGWRHVEDVRLTMPHSRQAFVAMWFDSSVDAAWLAGIRPALLECGYEPFRVDARHHNGRIDDVIMAELRRSGLVIADFTGHRGGVYFEAGVAIGRGIPLIWTAREDSMGDSHFDTRQYNHVVWKTPEELREKLKTRIMATLPVYPPIPGDDAAQTTA